MGGSVTTFNTKDEKVWSHDVERERERERERVRQTERQTIEWGNLKSDRKKIDDWQLWYWREIRADKLTSILSIFLDNLPCPSVLGRGVKISFFFLFCFSYLQASLDGIVCIYSTPPSRAEYDTWPIFKLSTTSINQEFFFLLDRLLYQCYRVSLSYYVPIEGRKINWDHLDHSTIKISWNT